VFSARSQRIEESAWSLSKVTRHETRIYYVKKRSGGLRLTCKAIRLSHSTYGT